MTTLLYTHEQCLDHVTPPGHPEQVARLEVISRALADPAFDALVRREAPLGAEADIRRAHPLAHLDHIRSSEPVEGFTKLDEDTSMAPGSYHAALRAVGANVAAVDAVLDGEARNAFIATRPPGHHAEKARPMGFCLFANVAIAALHAIENRGLDRVAVLDFDVHHGNGTQDVLWNESGVRFASSHQMPLYPGTGAPSERGAYDQIQNTALVPGSGSKTMREAWGEHILPWLAEYEPQLILVSAGFDAHGSDPLAGLNWTNDDYVWLTNRIVDLAETCCDGRVVSTLEGGYDLDALGPSVAAHVRTLEERGR
ncbi:MAG: histone deacetylase family protein [Maritimibacter harenae]